MVVRRVKQGVGRFSVTALALVMGGMGLGIPTLTADEPAADEPDGHQQACLIVDTDVGLDDYRAVATLLPARDVRAVVVTEGIAGVQRGSTAVSMFLASRGATPPVVPGLASAMPPAYDWLPAARAGAERMNNFLHAAVPFGRSPDRLTRDVGAAVRGCVRVDVLVLGPWTSYLRYASALGSNVHVVASGRPLVENNPDNFNCEYDLAACRSAVTVLGYARSVVFVDLPPVGADLTYDPTEAMVAQFEQAGMPGLLRAALQVDPSQWLGTRLWDDAAALYLLAPGKFEPVGRHVEPAVSEEVFRALLIKAVNAD
jgi:hypothetical protein